MQATRKPLVYAMFASLSLIAVARTQARGNDQLPVPGNPPLTHELMDKATRFYELLLDAQMTDEQRADFRTSLVRSWKSHRQAEIDNTMNVLRFEDQLNQKPPAERKVIVEALREKYLAMLRQTPNEAISRWALNIYDSAHRPIATGNPPLTQQEADAYAEFVLFFVTEATGERAFKANRHFKDAVAQTLAAQYSSYSPQQQQQFSQVPLLWQVLRMKWAQLSER